MDAAVTRRRGGIILSGDRGVAAIERIRDGQRYHTLPGGGCEPGEDPAAAAVRETWEELGLTVRVDGLAATVRFGASMQYYFVAREVAGTFGTGSGPELDSPQTSPAGGYRPVWLRAGDLGSADLRPRPLARLLAEAPSFEALLASWLAEPLEIHER